MDTASTPTPPVATRAALRARVATVTIPAVRQGPQCARHGCRYTAWFSVHHIPVCSSACAEAIAREIPQPEVVQPPVVRAVRWTSPEGVAWTVVIASCGRRHDWLRAWWWAGRGHVAGHRCQTYRSMDILTDAGLFRLLRSLVRRGATELRPLRIAAWAWERGAVATPPWTDVALPQDPAVLARGIVRRAKAKVRTRERVRALRARYRQRGVIQDGTTAHAARVA